jgi:hypothetical protein
MTRDDYESRRRRTLCTDSRGQTLQDFTLGVTLFIVTVTFVLGIFPGYLSPFTTGVTGAERAQADQVARSMLLNLSTADGGNTVNATRLHTVLNQSQEQLRGQFGLPKTAGVNITVVSLNGTKMVRLDRSGDSLATVQGRNNQTAGTVARVVSFRNNTKYRPRCNPGCRLVIKVW